MAEETVAVKDSILNSTKKILGVDESYDVFDLDITTHINATFMTIKQLGVGPIQGFVIEDENTKWEDFIANDPILLAATKTYVFLKVKMLFDPNTTSFNLEANKQLIQEAEWRLCHEAESRKPVSIPLELANE